MQSHRPAPFVGPFQEGMKTVEPMKPIIDPPQGICARKDSPPLTAQVNTPREKRRMPHLTDEQLRWTLQARLQRQEELDRNGTRNAELWNEIAAQFKAKHRAGQVGSRSAVLIAASQDAGQPKEDLDKIERPMYAALFEEHGFDVRDPPKSEPSEEVGGGCLSRLQVRINTEEPCLTRLTRQAACLRLRTAEQFEFKPSLVADSATTPCRKAC
eukprot:559435-Pyramimonas_sp.AAC.1